MRVNEKRSVAHEEAIEAAARESGFNAGPLWHGGSFSRRNGDFLFEPWTHFGTQSAAEERVCGSGVVDSLMLGIKTVEDNGKWYFSIDGLEDEEPYDSEEEAKMAAERDALLMAENTDPGDHDYTSVFLRGNYPRIPDLGTWGLWDVVSNLPVNCRLTPKERDSLGEISRSGRDGDDWAFFTSMLRKKGVDGFSYVNLVEHEGSVSYISISPLNIGLANPSVAYSDGANALPNERFSTKPVVPFYDKAYACAVKDGDVALSRRLVDAAIEAAGADKLQLDRFAAASGNIEWNHGATTILLTVPVQPAGVKSVAITSIRTPKAQQGNGSAKGATVALLACLDASGIEDVSLLASPLNSSTKLERLVGFYSKLGFVCDDPATLGGHLHMSRKRGVADASLSDVFRMVAGSVRDKTATLVGRGMVEMDAENARDVNRGWRGFYSVLT